MNPNRDISNIHILTDQKFASDIPFPTISKFESWRLSNHANADFPA
jgi:hypothetical protein